MRTHSNLVDRLKRARERLTQNPPSLTVEGRLTRMVGLALEATGCRLPVGGRAYVVTADGGKQEAEIVGFHGDNLYLMPKGDITGLEPGAPVIPIGRRPEISVGPGIMGRVVDGNGRPLDGLGPLHAETTFPLDGRRINPLQRKNIDTPLDVGVRAINALLTVGKGQRMGLFAGSGVGKSVLLGMMTRHTNADVIVVGL
ncbi:MAG: flagellum-specific ATP synthase FliI, partial [Gammaproteobacteria bacterium]